MMPPSPRLSARNTSVTYFRETTIIKVQKMAETPPRMLSGVSAMPWAGLNVSFAAYRGLVPMSPYTTPRASSVRAAVEFFFGATPVLIMIDVAEGMALVMARRLGRADGIGPLRARFF